MRRPAPGLIFLELFLIWRLLDNWADGWRITWPFVVAGLVANTATLAASLRKHHRARSHA